jgi:hypothetical protein
MEIRLFGITTNIWKIALGFSYLIIVFAFLDGALGISTKVHLLSNKRFPFALLTCWLLHNTYHFIITKSNKPFLHVFSLSNDVLSMYLILAILNMYQMNFNTLWMELDVDDQLEAIIDLSVPIFLIGSLFFVIPISIRVMYYFKIKTWMKKYTFYKHGLGTLDDVMKNNEFIFHVNLLTAAQVSELLVESFNLKVKAITTDLNVLITIEADLDWEYSALYYISENRPEILKKICDLNSRLPNIIFTSNYNKPFKRTKYYRQVLKPFILENY